MYFSAKTVMNMFFSPFNFVFFPSGFTNEADVQMSDKPYMEKFYWKSV